MLVFVLLQRNREYFSQGKALYIIIVDIVVSSIIFLLPRMTIGKYVPDTNTKYTCGKTKHPTNDLAMPRGNMTCRKLRRKSPTCKSKVSVRTSEKSVTGQEKSVTG